MERELLEIVLANPDRFKEVRSRVSPGEFGSERFRRIYQLCLELSTDGSAPELNSLRMHVDEPDLATFLSALAIAGERKGNVDRRLEDVLAAFERR